MEQRGAESSRDRDREEEGQDVAAKRGWDIPDEAEEGWEASSMTQSR